MADQNFSDRTQQLITAAREEAARLRHDFVGTEHILLAAARAPASAEFFQRVGVDPAAVVSRLEADLKPGAAEAAPGELGMRSGVKRVVDQALAAARDAGAETVEPEHLLTGLARDRRGIVGQVFGTLGANLDVVRPRRPAEERKPKRSPPAEAPPEDKSEEAPVPESKPAGPGEAVPPAAADPGTSAPPEPPREERGGERGSESGRRKKGGREAGSESGGRKGKGKRERERPQEKQPRQPPPDRAQADRGRRGRGRDRAEAEVKPEPDVPEIREPEPPAAAREPRLAVLSHREPLLTWRNALLLAIPACIGLYLTHASALLIFVTACVAILPLAGYMGEATEHLAHRAGPAVGGLLNATFGNAAELIIAIAALRAGLVDLVKASITGSILGNLLLILGLSLMAGGMKRPVLRFNRTAAGMSAAMLALAVVGLVMPAIFHHLHPAEPGRELQLSEGVATVLALTYLASLFFALKTHRKLFGGDEPGFIGTAWGMGRGLTVLALATAGVAVMSEILVHAVEAVTAELGLSQLFLGLIVIPLIGNAAEHATAVVMARKGKMDIAVGIALGSSTQVALLVAPLLVGIGLLFGPGMNLVFTPFEVAALGLSTVVCSIIMLDGESHWFEGVQLLAVYAVIAVGAFFI